VGRNRRSAAGAVPPDVMPSDGREMRARRENGKEGLEGREGSIHPSMACMLVCGGRAGPIAHRAEASREEEERRTRAARASMQQMLKLSRCISSCVLRTERNSRGVSP
jgi:hypothetical protein